MTERAAAQAGSDPARAAGPLAAPARRGGAGAARRERGRGGYFSSSTPFTFPSARRFSMIFCAMCGGTGS